jgi:hypothetical protein
MTDEQLYDTLARMREQAEQEQQDRIAHPEKYPPERRHFKSAKAFKDARDAWNAQYHPQRVNQQQTTSKRSKTPKIDALLNPTQPKGYTLGALLKMKVTDTDDIVDTMLQDRSITIIHGDPGGGKTFFVDGLVICISDEQKLFGELDVDPRPTLLLALEQKTDDFIKRAKRINEQLETVKYPDLVQVYPEWSRDKLALEQIIDWAEQHPRGLNIIDLFENIGYRPKGSWYLSELDKFTPFRRIANKYHVAFLLIFHSNRMKQLYGSNATSGSVDNVYRLEKIGKQDYLDRATLHAEKTRESFPESYPLRFNRTLTRWEYDPRPFTMSKETNSKSATKLFRVIQQYPNGVKMKKIRELLPEFSYSYLRELARLLVEAGYITHEHMLYKEK